MRTEGKLIGSVVNDAAEEASLKLSRSEASRDLAKPIYVKFNLLRKNIKVSLAGSLCLRISPDRLMIFNGRKSR